MRVIFLPFLMLVGFASAQADDSGFYDSRYDYLDVEAILNNKRLVKNYVDCLLNEKPCSPEGKALKRILPEGLRTKCARCTARQKHNALAVLRRLRSEYPEHWTRLAARWDPTGDLTKRFEAYLEHDDNNKIGDEKLTETTPIKPVLGNRFGAENEEKPSFSDVITTVRSVPTTSMRTPESTKPTPAPTYKTTTRMKFRPYSTRRPDFQLPPPIKVDLTPIYAGTMGLIDHFGNKIIKTTELVTDILRNTVRVVAGGKFQH